LTTDGGSADSAVLHLGGTGSGDYSADTASGNTFHFVTPYFAPDSNFTAYADFNVDSTGNGVWNLVISHGCSGVPVPPAADLTVTKDAAGSYDREYVWTIKKAVDKSEIDLIGGGTATFNYTVTFTNDGGMTITNAEVTGTISVTNPNNAAVTIDGVSDQLSDGTNCTVDTSSGLTIAANGIGSYPYSCDLSSYDNSTGTPPPSDLTNTAKAAWSDQTLDNGAFLKGNSASDTVPVSFTETPTDNCGTVTDTFNAGAARHARNGLRRRNLEQPQYDAHELQRVVHRTDLDVHLLAGDHSADPGHVPELRQHGVLRGQLHRAEHRVVRPDRHGVQLQRAADDRLLGEPPREKRNERLLGASQRHRL
jgi:hypothetical protein